MSEAKVKVEAEIPASVDAVWKLVSDFVGFIEKQGMPVTSEGEGENLTRTIKLGAAEIVEKFEGSDEAEHSTSYSIVSSPLPVTNYLSTVKLDREGDDKTKITWSSTFDATGPVDQAEELITNVYKGGIAAMQKLFGG